MKVLHQTYEINASIDKVWDALVNPKQIDKWGGGKAKMSEEIGFEFELWDGEIHGKNIKVVKNEKLVQEWYSGIWDKPSIVTFLLKQVGDKTIVDLKQIDIPDTEARDIEDGWQDYYMEPLKKLLES
ncbi:MAG: SRPBCC domain-containing protein [Patescibacteria group bacterium]